MAIAAGRGRLIMSLLRRAFRRSLRDSDTNDAVESAAALQTAIEDEVSAFDLPPSASARAVQVVRHLRRDVDADHQLLTAGCVFTLGRSPAEYHTPAPSIGRVVPLTRQQRSEPAVGASRAAWRRITREGSAASDAEGAGEPGGLDGGRGGVGLVLADLGDEVARRRCRLAGC